MFNNISNAFVCVQVYASNVCRKCINESVYMGTPKRNKGLMPDTEILFDLPRVCVDVDRRSWTMAIANDNNHMCMYKFMCRFHVGSG